MEPHHRRNPRLRHRGLLPARLTAGLLTMLGAMVALMYAASAQAQASRTWVSGGGDDANPCSRTAPCKTFPGAISKTAAGGEINCLDPGGFGAVTITKAITISCEHGTAGILVAGTNGIVVQAGPLDRVILRGLDINGFNGSGLSGIRFLSGATLNVEQCIIYGFANFGIDVALSSTGVLVVKDVTMPNPNTGIRVAPGSAIAVMTVDRTSITRAQTNGIELAAASIAHINNSTIALSGNSAVRTTAGAGAINLDNSEILSNFIGINAGSSGSLIQLNNNSLYGNNTAITVAAGAVLVSAGNNKLSGNVNNGATPGAATILR